VINRVVYLILYPFNDRDYDRFGLETVTRNGFDVEVWDLTPLIQPEILAEVQMTLTATGYVHRVFTDRQTASDAIAALDASSFVIAHVGYMLPSLFVYRALARAKAMYAVVASNAIPLAPASASPRLAWSKILHLTPAAVLRSFFHRAPSRWFGLRSADVVFVSTELALQGCRPVDATTRRIMVHAFDYDVFQRARIAPRPQCPPYGVFLDDFLPSHTDFIAVGGSPVRADLYYPRICAFFDKIEILSGSRIVVAAHPRSHYEEGRFGDREIIYGTTAELTCHAQFAITHASQSFSFAVLAEIPAIFLTMNAMVLSGNPVSVEFDERIRFMAEAAGKRPYNVDGPRPFDLGAEMCVDRERYSEYRHRYLKHPDSPDLPYWEIVSRFLRELP
jgi:hypothetical protein